MTTFDAKRRTSIMVCQISLSSHLTSMFHIHHERPRCYITYLWVDLGESPINSQLELQRRRLYKIAFSPMRASRLPTDIGFYVQRRCPSGKMSRSSSLFAAYTGLSQTGDKNYSIKAFYPASTLSHQDQLAGAVKRFSQALSSDTSSWDVLTLC